MNKKTSKIISRLLFRGILKSVIILLTALIVGIIFFYIWRNQHDEILSLEMLTAFFFVLIIYPFAVYSFLGVIRCAEVIWESTYAEFLQPKVSEIIRKYLNECDRAKGTEEKSNKGENNTISDEVDLEILLITKIIDALKLLPEWIQKLTRWSLSQLSLAEFLIELEEKTAKLPEEDRNKMFEDWLHHTLSNLIAELKPSWLNILVVLHIISLFGIWFL